MGSAGFPFMGEGQGFPFANPYRLTVILDTWFVFNLIVYSALRSFSFVKLFIFTGLWRVFTGFWLGCAEFFFIGLWWVMPDFKRPRCVDGESLLGGTAVALVAQCSMSVSNGLRDRPVRPSGRLRRRDSNLAGLADRSNQSAVNRTRRCAGKTPGGRRGGICAIGGRKAGADWRTVKPHPTRLFPLSKPGSVQLTRSHFPVKRLAQKSNALKQTWR